MTVVHSILRVCVPPSPTIIGKGRGALAPSAPLPIPTPLWMDR